MKVLPAQSSDFADVCKLALMTRKFEISQDLINSRDISLVARDEMGRCAGFLWCGLTANQTLGHIDYFMVHPEYRKQGVGQALARKALEIALERGVKRVSGAIRHDSSHEASAMNALKMTFKAYTEPFTLVYADVPEMAKLLKDQR